MTGAEEALAQVEPLLSWLLSRERPWGMEWEDCLQEARIAAYLAYVSWDEAMGPLSARVTVRVRSRMRDLWRSEKCRQKVLPTFPFEEWTGSAPSHETPVMNRAFLEAAIHRVPPSPRAWGAIRAIMSGQSVREAEREAGLSKDAYAASLSWWLKKVRFSLGLVDTPPKSRKRRTRC